LESRFRFVRFYFIQLGESGECCKRHREVHGALLTEVCYYFFILIICSDFKSVEVLDGIFCNFVSLKEGYWLERRKKNLERGEKNLKT